MTFEPIGVFHGGAAYKYEAPRQGVFAGGAGRVELAPGTYRCFEDGCGGGGRGATALPRRRIAEALDVDLDVAVAAFGGTAEDRRIWAAIAWRVGVDEFHYALMDKLSEDAADGAPESPAAAFQAFLNRRFPKEGGAA